MCTEKDLCSPAELRQHLQNNRKAQNQKILRLRQVSEDPIDSPEFTAPGRDTKPYLLHISKALFHFTM